MWTQGTKCCPFTKDAKPGYATWEEGVVSDLKKIHAVRPNMPTFGYYGFYGCCSPYNNDWFPAFNATPSLWLHDDLGRPVVVGKGIDGAVGHAYDLCNETMVDFYTQKILKSFMESDDVLGSFFDEVDSFIEGGGGNHPWAGYTFSDARKITLKQCFQDAMVKIIRFVTARGKFPIPSTNAYITQFSEWGNVQKTALSTYGGFKFVESFCPAFAPGVIAWQCPSHNTKEACCIDQLLSIMDHANDGIPLMIHIDQDPPPLPSFRPKLTRATPSTGTDGALGLAAFLIAAQPYSYVAQGQGWNGPSSFPLARRRLGAPKSNATAHDRARGVFSRSFECVDVVLNISAWSSALDWKC
jgi:hypothetical protein